MEQKKKTQNDYNAKYRKKNNQKNFSVMIDAEKVEKLTKKLKQQGTDKTKWVNEKIDEELKKD